ncbi:DUF1844 domain-containing protein [candidate division CSSED10-310 bacterium]|uniref:DUF1844 domain-containing protein n=1 Tax=candidate division CSSED10-310 bacterium TaxID=2855610 RepID=A0ABV6YUU8_UNCC1
MTEDYKQAERELQEILGKPFNSLVFSLYNSALISMGRISNPVTNKADIDLDQAQVTIEMVAMLKEKTVGNLDELEQKFIESQLAELRFAFTASVKEEQDQKK